VNWTPITIEKIYSLILETEKELHGDILTFWQSIKISPEKWNEETYGKEGGGFWVVGLIGKKVIYYNDIEDGFNVSDFENHGTIDEYVCNQDKLTLTIKELFDLGKSDRQINPEDYFPV